MDAEIKQKPFFHEIPDEEYDEMVKNGTTWDVVMEKYDGPPWCDVQYCAVGPMGCWSLSLTRSIRSEYDCKNCPEYNPE